MDSVIKKYPIRKNRLAQGLMDGFFLSDGGSLCTLEKAVEHVIMLTPLDSAQRDCEWGRFAFEAQVEDDMVLTVRAFATNDRDFIRSGAISSFRDFLLDPAIGQAEKEKLFQAAGGAVFTGTRDMLLYGQTGRYLWLCVELMGAGCATLSDFRVFTPGDTFFQTFPEIYRTNGEFFHRYLSIFSSLYHDLQATVDSLDSYIDVDTAPAALLPVFARWLGIEADGGFLEEDAFRRLLKQAFSLIRGKGTRKAVEGVANILLEEPVYLVERRSGGSAHSSPYDFTLLINRAADEKLHSRLKFLIDQFKPVRSRYNIVFMGECNRMDSFCCLDVNARLRQPGQGHMDGRSLLDGMTYIT